VKNLNQLTDSNLKNLFGFSGAILAQMMEIVLPILETEREKKLKTRSDRKRKYVTNDGRKRKVYARQKFLMTLIYLRQNVNHTVVGQMFGVSADTSENVFQEVIPILQREFPSQKWEAEKKWRKGKKWSPEEVDYLIIDSFETPIKRSSINEKQRKKYSGKKKMHTLKSQLITDQNGEIIQIDAGFDGPKSDIEIYRDTKLKKEWLEKPKLGDKAYIGEDIETPQKKPKGGELTEEEKEKNRELSAKRVIVEHGVRKVKTFKILRQDYRLGVWLYPKIAETVVGLIQFSRIVA
jgi:DDE superfamily endonuclease/Helix-turn-helix of DDE superfamily endonuclease